MSFGKGRVSVNFGKRLFMVRLLHAIFLMFILISCGNEQEKTYPVKTAITESVYSSVTIQPDSLYQAYAPVSGLLEENLVEEGDMVAKGEVIAQIINTSPKLATENARAALNLARKNYHGSAGILSSIEEELKAARLKYKDDSINYYRQEKLWAQGIGSQATFESRKLAYELSSNSVDLLQKKYSRTEDELQTQLDQAENTYRLALENTRDFSVTSKIDGKVYALHKNPGELITSSQPLASIGKEEDFVIEMLVDEVDIVRIKEGQPVLLTLDAYGEQVFEAEVSKIFPEKDERNQTFLVEALFTKAPDVLYPGLSGEANILIANKDSTVVIPRSYLVGRNKVRTEEGLVQVVTGLQSMDSVEILEGITSETLIYKPKE